MCYEIQHILLLLITLILWGLSWSWSFNSWICNQCFSSWKWWVPIIFVARCNRYNFVW